MSRAKPSPTMSPEPEKWTWEMAEEALKKNVSNRKLREGQVLRFTRLMEEKQWGDKNAKQGFRCSVAPVVYDSDGNLIDAQHRLMAQVRSRTTQLWYVLRDVPPSTQLIIDIGIPRTASDALKFEGYSNYTVLASIARWAWLLERGVIATGANSKVGSDEIVDMVARHPDLVHSAAMAAYAANAGSVYKPVLKTTYLGAAHWWIAQHNSHAEADMFVDRFVHPNKEVDGSAILAMMQRFITAEPKGEKIPIRTQIVMTLRAWNADAEGAYSQRAPAKTRGGDYLVEPPAVKERTISQEIRFGPYSTAEIESGEYDQPEAEEPQAS